MELRLVRQHVAWWVQVVVACAARWEDTAGMATQPFVDRYVPLEEYLSTVYEPDCEYEDGLVVERNLGEFEHSFLQIILGTLFTNNIEAWEAFGLTEQRVQIKLHHYLIPD